MAAPKIVRTTYYDEREGRFVTLLFVPGKMSFPFKHARTVTNLAAAKRAGAKVTFPNGPGR